MDVKLSSELQAKLDRVAMQRGRDRASLIREAVEHLVDYDDWFMRQVDQGLAQVQRGEVFEEKEVAERLERLIDEKQRGE